MILRTPVSLLKFSVLLRSRYILQKKECLLNQNVGTIKKAVASSNGSKVKTSRLPLTITCFSVSLIGSKSFSTEKIISEEKQLVQQKAVEIYLDWRKLFELIYSDIWLWLGSFVAAVGVAYINILLPLNLGNIVNVISSLTRTTLEYEDIQMPALKLIGLYISQALGTFCYISLLSTAGERLAFQLRRELYENIIKQDMAFFDKRRTADLLDCLFTDVQEFKSSFKQCVSQGAKNLFQICGCVVSLFKISPLMTFTILTVVPTLIITGTVYGILLRSISSAAQRQSVKAFALCEEVLGNIRTVRSFGNEALECKKFANAMKESAKLNTLLGHGIGVFQAGSNLFLNGLVLGTLYVGSRFIVSEELSSGDLMSFLVTAQMIQKSFAQLSMTFGHYLKGKQSFERICFYSRLKPLIPIEGGTKIPYHSFIPNIEFKNVTFSYPTRPTQVILNNLNLTLPAGKTVAVVGASGNGKSTIALLLERFYDVKKGSITIDGVNICDLDPHWLRSSAIGIINQEPVLFATTIKENIMYGKPTATDEEVYEAARLANAHEFIQGFPKGYDTIVGERGAAISGGQKQRIAIARALIKKPVILILDEATSALDPEAEKVVQKTLETVCHGRTVLVIAHRLSTVQNADLIVVLHKGAILERGTHDSLMKEKGIYFNLMNQQKEKSRSYG